jgi:Uma2 family endonuclease
MALGKKEPRISVEEYLEREKDGSVRHEYVDGRIFAMSGASLRHSLIINNVSRWLAARAGDGCNVFTNDAKVKVGTSAYYYPDIVMTCSELPQNEYVCPEPLLLIEVLSPSTEQIDRREKLLAYQRISSVKEYVIVAQDQVLLEVYRWQQDGELEHETLTDGDDLRLTSTGADLPLSEIYRGVSFGP